MQLASQLLEMKHGEPGNGSLAIDQEWWTPSPLVLHIYRAFSRGEMSPRADDIHALLTAAITATPNRAATRTGTLLLPHGKPGMRVRYFPSRKNKAAVPCTGQSQRNFALLCEADPEIERFSGHPLESSGAGWKYKPGFVLRMRNGRLVVVDVLPAGKEASPSRLAKALACSQLLRAARIDMRILSDKSIHAANGIDNLRYLYHRAAFVAVDEISERVFAYMDSASDKPTLGAVRQFAVNQGWPPNAAEALLWEGRLRCDLTRRISPTTVVFGGHHG